MRSNEGRRVLVVGAGLAGLAAAQRLTVHGLRVSVLEARPRVGGSLAPERLGPFEFSPRLHSLPASSPHLAALLREVGAEARVRRVPLERVLELGSGGLRVIEFDSDRLLHGSWIPGLGVLRRRRLRQVLAWLGSELDPNEPGREDRLDDRSVSDFVRLYLGESCAREVFSRLFEFHLGLDAAGTSRSLLFQLVDAEGLPRLASAFGLHCLPQQLAAGLDDVRTGTAVDWVAPGGDAVGLENGERLEAEAVVLATPPVTVPKLVRELTPIAQSFFADAGCVDSVSLACVLEGTLDTPLPILWTSRDEVGPLGSIVDLSGWQTERAGSSSLLLLGCRREVVEGGHWQTDDELARALLGQADALLPGIRARVREQRLMRREDAIPCFGVGRYRQIARLRRERAESGRALFLAGAHLVAPHAEGAVISGLRAADELISALS